MILTFVANLSASVRPGVLSVSGSDTWHGRGGVLHGAMANVLGIDDLHLPWWLSTRSTSADDQWGQKYTFKKSRKNDFTVKRRMSI